MIVFLSLLLIVYLGLIFIFFNYFVLLNRKKEERKKELRDYPFVSIIVPAYNEEKNIRETLESLINLDYPKDKLEIIVVDDGSTDKTYEIAKEYEKNYPFIKVYKKPNGGKASALNFGIRLAKGEYIITLDADSIVPRDALKKMLNEFDEETGAVTPAIQVKEAKTFLQKIQYVEYAYNNVLKMILDKLDSIYVTPGPFSIYKREVFEKIGLFDENNLTEDMEIAFRMHAYGYKVKFVPDVIVKTEVPKDFKGLLRQRLRWYLGFLENFLKYYNKIDKKFLSELIMPSSILFIALALLYLFINIYFTIKGWYTNLKYTITINFDILPEILYTLQNFKIDLESWFYSFCFGGSYLSMAGIVSFICFLILLREYWKIEKPGLKSKLLVIPYSLFYIFLYSLFWVVVLYYKIFGKELRWGNIIWRNSLINKIFKNNM